MFSAPMISFFMISIHAPARGATTIPKIQLLTERHFNPRSREGSDAILNAYGCSVLAFQSTLPRGERHVTLTMMLPLFLFQSTLPRGERLNSIPVIASRHNFNPRSREGSDSIIHILKDHFYISIHAPARGATGCSKEQRYSLKISIHAPARGATTIYWVFVACVGISIHAPARGATPPYFHSISGT